MLLWPSKLYVVMLTYHAACVLHLDFAQEHAWLNAPECRCAIRLLCLLQHWPLGQGSVAVLRQLGRWGFKGKVYLLWASYQEWLRQWSAAQNPDFADQMLIWQFLGDPNELLQVNALS